MVLGYCYVIVVWRHKFFKCNPTLVHSRGTKKNHTVDLINSVLSKTQPDTHSRFREMSQYTVVDASTGATLHNVQLSGSFQEIQQTIYSLFELQDKCKVHLAQFSISLKREAR